ncbi:MAG: iron ABC transporter permease [Rhizobium sp.]|nr:iron ABC transporter permease [Rhizobium sp.]
MNASKLLSGLVAAVIFLALVGSGANGQGFAELGTKADGFAVPKPGVPLAFPADHGAHPDYRIEWWYLTANLKGEDGKAYGAQWTLFRSALAPGRREGWSSPQIWMGHAAITTGDRQFVAERLSRDGIDQSGVTAAPFAAWIDDWRMQLRSLPDDAATQSSVNLSAMSVNATGKDFSYQLSLDAVGPVVAQGQQGYSVKSPAGQASYYYSQPFYAVTGSIMLPTGEVKVTGNAWLDHEWSSQPLAADQTGWDWFSLHLQSGEKLMGFRLRDSGNGFTSATWIAADGTASPMMPGDLTMTPTRTTVVDGRDIPTAWHLELPKRKFDVVTTPLNPQAWMKTRFEYWEGPISFEGTHRGIGYLEMTGYK